MHAQLLRLFVTQTAQRCRFWVVSQRYVMVRHAALSGLLLGLQTLLTPCNLSNNHMTSVPGESLANPLQEAWLCDA